MTKFKIDVEYLLGSNLESIPNYIIKKRMFLWRFIPIGWEIIAETENSDDLKPYIAEFLKETKNETEK